MLATEQHPLKGNFKQLCIMTMWVVYVNEQNSPHVACTQTSLLTGYRAVVLQTALPHARESQPSLFLLDPKKTQMKLLNWAVLIKHQSRFCHCIACFSQNQILVHEKACNQTTIAWNQTSRNHTPPNLQHIIHQQEHCGPVRCILVVIGFLPLKQKVIPQPIFSLHVARTSKVFASLCCRQPSFMKRPPFQFWNTL